MGSLAVVRLRSAPPEPEKVREMLAAAPHRGTTFDVLVSGDVALGVATTPDRLEDAWLASEDGTAAAFAGALDNHAELKRALADENVIVSGDDPASTVLAAFRAWGDAAPGRFRGMFTGAVSDARGLRLFRDHVGFHTLYYREDPRGFFAATEAKQVLAGTGLAREPNLEGLEILLFNGSAVPLRGLERFPSTSLGVVDERGKVSFSLYWDPSALVETARVTVAEASERVGELLEQAVRRCLTGTDAVTLSGGLDSPSDAAFAAPRHLELSGKPLVAVSAVYPDYPAVDESSYIELVSQRLGLELHTFVPTANSLDDVELWVTLLDAPVMTFSVPEAAESYRHAREHGAKVVLGGDLAEFVFALRYYFYGHLFLHGRWRALARHLRERHARGHAWSSLLRGVVAESLPPVLAVQHARLRNRNPWQLPEWLERTRGDAAGRFDRMAARRRFVQSQIDPTGRGGVSATLEANEICAAYCGVHARSPFADVDLWEFVLSLRAETKFPDRVTKRLVREAVNDRLPPEIVWRRDKTSFDDHVLATAEYPELERWILRSPYRLPRVDYDLLARRIGRRELSVFELQKARDLARIHAFLASCE